MSGRSVLLSDQSSGRTASCAITLMEYYQPSEVAKLTDIWCVADRQLGAGSGLTAFRLTTKKSDVQTCQVGVVSQNGHLFPHTPNGS